MRIVCRLALVFVLVLAAAPVYAQSVLSSTVPTTESDAFEELRSTLRPGTLVSVEDGRGRRRTGRFRDIADSRVYVESGSMPLTESFGFDEIVTIKAVDSRRNGFWTGFAVGAVPGLMFGAAMNSYCYNEGPSHCPTAIPLLGGLTGLAGGGIGWLIDAAFEHGQVLVSRRPGTQKLRINPVVDASSRSGGVALSLAF